MEVIPFLEYLSEDGATRELAESLALVFQLRRRPELVPTAMLQPVARRVAS